MSAFDFSTGTTEQIARALLGAVLVSHTKERTLRGSVCETEAYVAGDLANHAVRYKTKRTQPLFNQAGTIYIYGIYGKYYCLNIVTAPGEAVLIRGIIIEDNRINGPGRVCRTLSLTSDISGLVLGEHSGLHVEKPKHMSTTPIISTPRIGIRVEEPWQSASLRFVLP